MNNAPSRRHGRGRWQKQPIHCSRCCIIIFMNIRTIKKIDPCCPPSSSSCCAPPVGLREKAPSCCIPDALATVTAATCCGPAATVRGGEINEQVPGFLGWLATPAGRVPRIATDLTFQDRLGACKARWAIGRMTYIVPPGLYALGNPTAESPVVVTANYKMSYDIIRSVLAGSARTRFFQLNSARLPSLTWTAAWNAAPVSATARQRP